LPQRSKLVQLVGRVELVSVVAWLVEPWVGEAWMQVH
jgi:hypothetical protein